MSTENPGIPALSCDKVRGGVLSFSGTKAGKLVFSASRVERYTYGVIEIEYSDGMTVEVDVGAPEDKLKEKVWSLNSDILAEEDIGSRIKVRYNVTLPGGELKKSEALTFIVEQ